jgi:uncharacterized protein
MYNKGDNTYLMQPKFMKEEIVEKFALELREYSISNNVKEVFIAFHGGEPLLADKEFYRNFTHILNTNMKQVADVIYTLQTNGTLLDEDWCKLLNELNIQPSISADGPKDFHDKYRVYHNGKGSFDDVEKGILRRNQSLNGGLISVININIPPDEFYKYIRSHQTKVINILLPDSHYDDGEYKAMCESKKSKSPYGDWLVVLYEMWKKDDFTKRPQINFFKNIVNCLMGKEVGDELVGSQKCGVACIETDGAIEVVDPLRICGSGFTRNSLNILNNPIADLEKEKLFGLYYESHQKLCNTCENCTIREVCGGGYLGRRYSAENGFDNPSIYCKDLVKIITHIQNDIFRSLPESVISELGIDRLEEDQLVDTINGLLAENLRNPYLNSFSRSGALTT